MKWIKEFWGILRPLLCPEITEWKIFDRSQLFRSFVYRMQKFWKNGLDWDRADRRWELTVKGNCWVRNGNRCGSWITTGKVRSAWLSAGDALCRPVNSCKKYWQQILDQNSERVSRARGGYIWPSGMPFFSKLLSTIKCDCDACSSADSPVWHFPPQSFVLLLPRDKKRTSIVSCTEKRGRIIFLRVKNSVCPVMHWPHQMRCADSGIAISKVYGEAWRCKKCAVRLVFHEGILFHFIAHFAPWEVFSPSVHDRDVTKQRRRSMRETQASRAR